MTPFAPFGMAPLGHIDLQTTTPEGQFWTPVADVSDTWTVTSDASDLWTPVTPPSGTWT